MDRSCLLVFITCGIVCINIVFCDVEGKCNLTGVSGTAQSTDGKYAITHFCVLTIRNRNQFKDFFLCRKIKWRLGRITLQSNRNIIQARLNAETCIGHNILIQGEVKLLADIGQVHCIIGGCYRLGIGTGVVIFTANGYIIG